MSRPVTNGGLKAEGEDFILEFDNAPDVMELTEVGGGWNEHRRHGADPVLEYEGPPARRLRVETVFDRYPGLGHVETPINQIEALARPSSERGWPRRPPRVRFLWSTWQGIWWRVDRVETPHEDDTTVRNDRRRRVRQRVIIELIEAPDESSTPAERGRDRSRRDSNGDESSSSGGHRVHTMQSGDTLWDLAVKHLEDGSRWTEIADASDIDDPEAIPVGTEVRIPRE